MGVVMYLILGVEDNAVGHKEIDSLQRVRLNLCTWTYSELYLVVPSYD